MVVNDDDLIFISNGNGIEEEEDVPEDATHILLFNSITSIAAHAFQEHPNIVEVDSHEGVKRIDRQAFFSCPSLERAIIPSVEILGLNAFNSCAALEYVECDRLQQVGSFAFGFCKSLRGIDLPSAQCVNTGAFFCCGQLTSVKFGSQLEIITDLSFVDCFSLESITIPLKNGLIAADDVFTGCKNLKSVDLLETKALNATIDALHFEAWRKDMIEEINSIAIDLSNASVGKYHPFDAFDAGEKARTIRGWISSVLHKIIRYKAQHTHMLIEAASALRHTLPHDLMANNVISFLDLPTHEFDREDQHDEVEEGEVDEEILDYEYYDLHAQEVNLEDITSSAQNADILRGLRDNNAQPKLEIFGYEECEYADEDNDEVKLMEMDKEQPSFIVRERDHIGWIAYFLSKDKAVKSLFIHTMPKAEIGTLMNGIKHNTSIRRFDLFDAEIDCEALAHFIVHNSKLKSLWLWFLDIGANFASNLASALIQREGKTLTSLSLRGNNFSNDDIEEIASAVSDYKRLKTLDIDDDLIGRDQEQEYCNVLADSISLEDISSCHNNIKVLRKLRDNGWDESVELNVVPNYYNDYGDIEEEENYFVGEDDDWGWFAYFIGRSKQLKYLTFFDCPIEGDDNRDAIIAGLNRNKYIEKLDIREWQIECSNLSPFIISNNNLKILEFWNVDIGPDSACNLALALHQRQHKTLTRLIFSRNNLSIDSFESVIESLRGYPHLLSLSFSENQIGREMCSSKGLFVSLSALPVKELFLNSTDLDDEDLTALVATMSQSKTLQILCLQGTNPS